MDLDHAQKPVVLLGGPGGLHLTGQVEIVPADDAVLDEAVAAFGDFLFFSACSRPRGFPTATARVKLFELDQEIWTEKTGYMNPMADYVPLLG